MSSLFSLGFGVLGLLGAALGRFGRFAVLRHMQGASALFGIAGLLDWGVHVAALGGRWADWSAVLLLVAIGYLAARLVLFVIFEFLLAQRVGVAVPRLARDVAALLLYLLVAASVLRIAFDMDVGALLATSAVITVVIGLALQETLGTLLAGLALVWEKRVSTGEWVEVDGVVGQAEELGWRSLLLRTNLDERVLLPNSMVVRARMRLLGHGATPVAVPIRLGVAYEARPHEVKQVLERVAADTPGVVDDPPPRILTSEFADSAIVYECRLWTREAWRSSDVTDRFLTSAHAALARAGMEIPFPQRTLHVAPRRRQGSDVERCREACERCDLFSGLPEDVLAGLGVGSRLLVFAPGEAVVREDEASRALYVVASGEAEAVRGGERLNRIGPGEAFGEIAFLLGVPRAATVRAVSALEVVEVDAGALHGVLAGHASVADELARRVAAHRQAMAERDAETAALPAQRSLASALLERLHRLVSG